MLLHICLWVEDLLLLEDVDYKKNNLSKKEEDTALWMKKSQPESHMNEYINESISQPFLNAISNCTTDNKARGANESSLMMIK